MLRRQLQQDSFSCLQQAASKSVLSQSPRVSSDLLLTDCSLLWFCILFCTVYFPSREYLLTCSMIALWFCILHFLYFVTAADWPVDCTDWSYRCFRRPCWQFALCCRCNLWGWLFLSINLEVGSPNPLAFDLWVCHCILAKVEDKVQHELGQPWMQGLVLERIPNATKKQNWPMHSQNWARPCQ